MIIDPSVIRQVSREKDIDPEKMFGALEEAMSSAARGSSIATRPS